MYAIRSYYDPGPAAVRYPRGHAGGTVPQQTMTALPIGRARQLRRGHSGLAILAFGTLLQQAKPVAEALDATLVDMRFVKPLDTELLSQLLADHQQWVTLEENALMGGAGSAVNEWLMTQRQRPAVLNLRITSYNVCYTKLLRDILITIQISPPQHYIHVLLSETPLPRWAGSTWACPGPR